MSPGSARRCRTPALIRSWACDAIGCFHPDYEWHALARHVQTPGEGERFVEEVWCAEGGAARCCDRPDRVVQSQKWSSGGEFRDAERCATSISPDYLRCPETNPAYSTIS